MDTSPQHSATSHSISRRFNFIPFILVLIFGLAGVSALIAAKPTPQPQPEPEAPSPMKVEVLRANIQDTTLAVTTQGTVEPRHSISLVAQVGGQVINVSSAFDNGGFFDKDEVLLEIDDSDYIVALLNARSRLADAKRQLAEEKGRARQAKREWRDLGNKDANDLFMRKPQLAAAEAQVKLAEGQLVRAELDLERTKVRAPFAGRLRVKRADLGQIVAANIAVAEIYSQTAMQVRLPLTEQQAALIDLPLSENKNGDGASVDISATLAGKKVNWQGHLNRAEAFVDENSRMFYAWVDIEQDSQLPALPGLFVDAKINGKTLTEVIQLPRSALVNRNKIVTIDADNKTVWNEASVLYKNSSKIWIRAALNNDDRVLLNKQTLAPEGTEVEPFESALSEDSL